MPTINNQIVFHASTKAAYDAATKVADDIYFITDTKQIYVGSDEYTKSMDYLQATPTSSTVGDIGKLYAYNGNLYVCKSYTSGTGYEWVRVANVSDSTGSVTSIAAGDGLSVANSENPITSTGTLEHSIPEGASAHADSMTDQTPSAGTSFNIQSVSTDKFGHVTSINTHTVTLPEDANTTYTISASSNEGEITVTPSEGNAYNVAIPGWSLLAKKSDIVAVFKYKGTVANVAALPQTSDVEVGWVYHVTDTSEEYVAKDVDASATPVVTWESLGGTIDLSAYALSADVIQRVTGATGEVPKFKADGTVESTGFTLGTSVPADAQFTDTTYEDATQSTSGLMSATDKTKLDGIEAGAQVNTITGVKGSSEATYRTGDVSIAPSDLGITVVNNTLDANKRVAYAAEAGSATNDGSGNNIVQTYATKEEATLKWTAV